MDKVIKNERCTHIVEEKIIDGTRIIICDDYAVKTIEERIKILTKFKECIYKIYNK